jgi:hydroxymethylbilane synthase
MDDGDEPIRLATRTSDLARRQAALVADRLRDRRIEVELVPVESDGDRIRDELIHELGTTGAFSRALDERVLDGDVDGAVHSMKDLPTEPSDLVVAAIPGRGPAGDVLVTPDGRTLDDLPEEAVVGTASLRRRAQLLAERSDLTVEPVRGNVDTRVEKLLAPHLQAEHERRLAAEEAAEDSGDESDDSTDEGTHSGGGTEDGSGATDDGAEADGGPFDRSVEEWFDGLAEVERRALERAPDMDLDAIVLAQAGLDRLGLDRHVTYQPLPTETFVPAPGQGAVAVTMRDGDAAERVNDVVDHPRTRVEATVERTILAELGGGCVAPLGAHAVVQGDRVHTTVRVLATDGTETVKSVRDLPVERHREAARDLASDLAAEGAADLVAAARDDADATDPSLEESA